MLRNFLALIVCFLSIAAHGVGTSGWHQGDYCDKTGRCRVGCMNGHFEFCYHPPYDTWYCDGMDHGSCTKSDAPERTQWTDRLQMKNLFSTIRSNTDTNAVVTDISFE